MTAIESNIKALRKEIPDNVKIVAVSKTKPVEDILSAYNSGHRIFGENRVPELVSKCQALPVDIEWHSIGHLQTNKVRHLLPFVSVIQSVDSFRLLEVIDKESARINRITDCLLQFHIAKEETKSGSDEQEALEMIHSAGFGQLRNVRICGVMGMATYTDDHNLVRDEFKKLRSLFDTIKSSGLVKARDFREISMGMSGDYLVAVSEGATIVRIGSLIFGERLNK